MKISSCGRIERQSFNVNNITFISIMTNINVGFFLCDEFSFHKHNAYGRQTFFMPKKNLLITLTCLYNGRMWVDGLSYFYIYSSIFASILVQYEVLHVKPIFCLILFFFFQMVPNLELDTCIWSSFETVDHKTIQSKPLKNLAHAVVDAQISVH